MKKNYNSPEAGLVKFETDVVTASGGIWVDCSENQRTWNLKGSAAGCEVIGSIHDKVDFD